MTEMVEQSKKENKSPHQLTVLTLVLEQVILVQ